MLSYDSALISDVKSRPGSVRHQSAQASVPGGTLEVSVRFARGSGSPLRPQHPACSWFETLSLLLERRCERKRVRLGGLLCSEPCPGRA